MKHPAYIFLWALVIRFSLSVSVSMVALTITPTPAFAGDIDTALQCMADCIIEEGAGAKATCKQRCANIDIDMNQGLEQSPEQGLGQNKDCMATYKQCKKDCKGENDCRKTCKQGLMNCV